MDIKNLMKKVDKKTLNILYFIFLLGVCLMTIDISPKKEVEKEDEILASQESFDNNLEDKMEDIFSKTEGVGKVQVLINYKSSEETVIAKDKIYDCSESEGSKSVSSDEKVVLNSGEPVVLRSDNPRIQGVVIVAEGGDDVNVKNQLIRSAQALLGVEVNKIEVLKMKS